MIASTHLSLLAALKDDHQRQAAWEQFWNRYRETIFRWCLRRGLQAADAEDVTQTVLTGLYQSLPRYQHDPAKGRFRSWLQTVVHNAIRDRERAARRHPADQGVGGSSFHERLMQVEALDDLARAIERQGTQGPNEPDNEAFVERARARVEEVTWKAFWRHVVDEQPAQEVARELGLKVASVYQAKYRVARLLAQEYLGQNGKPS